MKTAGKLSLEREKMWFYDSFSGRGIWIKKREGVFIIGDHKNKAINWQGY